MRLSSEVSVPGSTNARTRRGRQIVRSGSQSGKPLRESLNESLPQPAGRAGHDSERAAFLHGGRAESARLYHRAHRVAGSAGPRRKRALWGPRQGGGGVQQPVRQMYPAGQGARHATPHGCLPPVQIGVGQFPPDPPLPPVVPALPPGAAAAAAPPVLPPLPPAPPVPVGVQSGGNVVLPRQSSQRPQSLVQVAAWTQGYALAGVVDVRKRAARRQHHRLAPTAGQGDGAAAEAVATIGT